MHSEQKKSITQRSIRGDDPRGAIDGIDKDESALKKVTTIGRAMLRLVRHKYGVLQRIRYLSKDASAQVGGVASSGGAAGARQDPKSGVSGSPDGGSATQEAKTEDQSGAKNKDGRSERSGNAEISKESDGVSKPDGTDGLHKGMSLGIPSTSLGFSEERVGDDEDPNKWIKFGFKYAGAVVVFLIAFGSLRAYEASLEAEAAKRRKEQEGSDDDGPEEDQTAHPFLGQTTTPATDSGNPPIENGGAPASQAQTPFQNLPQNAGPLFPAIANEQESETFSPLEELLVEQVELESKLRTLRQISRSRESDASKKEVKSRLSQLEKEIQALEKTN
ncbi:hypothetical protein NDN08_002566 [Rhodosorus marinus]|uniref:Uncharacterized protein n=1 Tax=Rhodosorus marinus TaxID=101924 RepID=A0AAV8UYB7_9RHOD|nr:hypothetical protein NDN08_002566 [Rhodosorus marinus]